MGNSREAATGDLMGQIQQIIDNSSREAGKYDPIHDIWTYFSQNIDPRMANQLLAGNQSRTMGQVGQSAGAQAAAYGVTNPYAWIQHAQAGVADKYASQFADLPFKVSQQNLMANQGNFMNLYRLLALKGGLSGQRSGGFSEWGPGLIEGGGKVGAAAILASDRRLKKNIVKLFDRPDGIGVYKFEYLWGGKHIGVMADEVENIIPEAVFTHSSGYQMVDYSKLG